MMISSRRVSLCVLNRIAKLCLMSRTASFLGHPIQGYLGLSQDGVTDYTSWILESALELVILSAPGLERMPGLCPELGLSRVKSQYILGQRLGIFWEYPRTVFQDPCFDVAILDISLVQSWWCGNSGHSLTNLGGVAIVDTP